MVKNRLLDPFTDQMICKLIAHSPQGSDKVKKIFLVKGEKGGKI